MTLHVLTAEQWFPRPVEEVFAFFADAGNLQDITPPMLDFRILTPRPITMRVGTLIDYRLRLRGIPMRWRTRITAWEPGVRFVDEQLSGPYRRWHHEHAFEARDGGTLMRDRVEYDVGLGPLGDVAHALFVRRDVERIFAYRFREMEVRLGGASGARRGSVGHPPDGQVPVGAR